MTKQLIFAGMLILVACFICGFVAMAQQAPAEANGPVLGKWEFYGHDDKELIWSGTMNVSKLDTSHFGAETYFAMIELALESEEGSKGVETPCKYDKPRREVTFETSIVTYTATLSPDGKMMFPGKWTNYDVDSKTRKKTIKGTGEWQAKYVGP